MRPCLECGTPTRNSRCPTHQRQHDRATKRHDLTTRAWRTVAAQVKATHPWCAECGSTVDLTVDHIVPKSLGGSDDPSNLRVLCRAHNSRRGNRI